MSRTDHLQIDRQDHRLSFVFIRSLSHPDLNRLRSWPFQGRIGTRTVLDDPSLDPWAIFLFNPEFSDKERADSLVATKTFFSINESITAAQIVAKLSNMATSAGEKFEQIENCIELNEL